MRKKLSNTSAYLIILGAFLLVVNVSLGLLLTFQSSSSMTSQIQARMLDVANSAAAMIDGDDLANIQAEDVNTPEYQTILKTLGLFLKHIDLSYIYCVRDMGDRRFVFTIDPDDDPAIFGEETISTEALYQASLGTPAVDNVAFEDRWGRFYSAYSPVFDSHGNVAGIVAVDFDADWYDEQIYKLVGITMGVMVGSIVIGGVLLLLLALRYRKKFDMMYDELNDLAGGIEALAREVSQGSQSMEETDTMLSELDEEDFRHDDIGALTNRIRSLQSYLGKQINVVHGMAYLDSLTGVQNRTAYLEYVQQLDEQIERGEAEFIIAMFDINSLKIINDLHGHEVGDKAILRGAHILKRVFEGERVFRIGGDEFIVILDCPIEEIEAKFEEFDRLLAAANKDGDGVSVTISKGYSVFNSDLDKSYQMVFVRADDQMYAEKKAYYLLHGDPRL